MSPIKDASRKPSLGTLNDYININGAPAENRTRIPPLGPESSSVELQGSNGTSTRNRTEIAQVEHVQSSINLWRHENHAKASVCR